VKFVASFSPWLSVLVISVGKLRANFPSAPFVQDFFSPWRACVVDNVDISKAPAKTHLDPERPELEMINNK